MRGLGWEEVGGCKCGEEEGEEGSGVHGVGGCVRWFVVVVIVWVVCRFARLDGFC